MNAEAIRGALDVRPFEPIEAVLSSGQIFAIERPENAIVTNNTLVVANPETDTVQWISLVHVVALRHRQASLPSLPNGQIVSINNQVGVVVFTGKDLNGDMEDHTGVWFGICENGVPEVWTIPTEYLSKGPRPVIKH